MCVVFAKSGSKTICPTFKWVKTGFAAAAFTGTFDTSFKTLFVSELFLKHGAIYA